ncbi:MAG: DUF4364 family protein [Lachnospiraceae bacterium]|nr:DUF4364 family protein [Lachnospiraceae bacterium]
MISEPMTLYKLMILAMLKRVKFPLANSQISDFFLENEYTSYFTLQQAISELIETNLISRESTRTNSLYQLTRQGEETLSFFVNEISPAIIEDIEEYLKKNKVRLRNEVSVLADYYKNTANEYTVHCEIREGRTQLIELNVSVPDKADAEKMCSRWQRCNQSIYSFIMKELLGN